MEFAVEISEPLCNIFNSASLAGIWPSLWKQEIVTPIPKTFPPKSTDDLRKIAGTKNLSKIFEALLSESIIADIQPNIDLAQYGNQKGLSTAHYLVKLVNRILTILDTYNSAEKYAVIAHLIDWSKAFDRVDPTIGMKAFIANGLRPSLIPILGSFFQDRKMIVKWHDCMSEPRDLPGGGPQGSTFGNLQYNVSSNDNANHVPINMKFKFVDDLSTLEKLNLILAGLSSYNFKSHVASDIGISQSYISSNNLESQGYLSTIETWTSENKSKLNVDKSKIMIFNFNESMQFSTRLYLEETLLETIAETKLLGTVLTSDLKWDKNTEMIVKKAYGRMQILHKLVSFKVKRQDLKEIYFLYIRSLLEFNCQVWHFSLTEEDISSIERVQKVACRLILQSEYQDYAHALKTLQLETLEARRYSLSLKFAKKCIKHPKAADMFPVKTTHDYATRNPEKFIVQRARTSRLRNSSVPQLQRALNHDFKKQKS